MGRRGAKGVKVASNWPFTVCARLCIMTVNVEGDRGFSGYTGPLGPQGVAGRPVSMGSKCVHFKFN